MLNPGFFPRGRQTSMRSAGVQAGTIQSIEALIEDADFERLNQQLGQPTLFDILGISTDELVHSRMLAWLLNPAESHGLGSKALRRFLYTAAKVAQSARVEFGQSGMPITPLLAETFSLIDVRLRCEYLLSNQRRPDVVLWSVDERWLCVIENKILSEEGEEQTTSYYEEMLKSFPPERFCHRLFVYLTPDGEVPESRRFVAVSYYSVMQVLEKVRGTAADFGRMAIDQYASCLRGRIVEQDQLEEICWKLYRNHRSAINAILEYGDVNMLANKTRDRVLEILRRDDGKVMPGRRLEWACSKGVDWIAVWPRSWPIKMTALKYPGFFKIWWGEPASDGETIQIGLGFDRPHGPTVRSCFERLAGDKATEMLTLVSVTAKNPTELPKVADEAARLFESLVTNSFVFLEDALRMTFPDQWSESRTAPTGGTASCEAATTNLEQPGRVGL